MRCVSSLEDPRRRITWETAANSAPRLETAASYLSIPPGGEGHPCWSWDMWLGWEYVELALGLALLQGDACFVSRAEDTGPSCMVGTGRGGEDAYPTTTGINAEF